MSGLAATLLASPNVFALFAILHDACRRNDDRDPEHRQRGAELAARFRGSLFHLPDADFALLRTACAVHTKGLLDADITVQVCWDAARLDLARVGIRPKPGLLCTPASRDPEMRRWPEEQRRDGGGEVPMEWGGLD